MTRSNSFKPRVLRLPTCFGSHAFRYIWVAIFFSARVIAADSAVLPACNIERSALVAFSGTTPTDKLSVSVKGAPCYKAIATFSITSKGGKVLYRYSQPFKELTAIAWDAADLDKVAESFVSETITKGMPGRSSALPMWTEPDKFYEANYTSLSVSHQRYDEIRKLDVPVFYHRTYYEGRRHVIYDPLLHEAVVVMEGGL
ncbi:MAG: hypothetical protein ABI451_13035 [Dokdonella sp.]